MNMELNRRKLLAGVGALTVSVVMPGDNLAVDIETVASVPIEEGLRFTVREGGRTVGTGVVTKIIA